MEQELHDTFLIQPDKSERQHVRSSAANKTRLQNPGKRAQHAAVQSRSDLYRLLFGAVSLLLLCWWCFRAYESNAFGIRTFLVDPGYLTKEETPFDMTSLKAMCPQADLVEPKGHKDLLKDLGGLWADEGFKRDVYEKLGEAIRIR
jgi:hypothetical protein